MSDALHVMPWVDPVTDTLGHDPRSWYTETFWLPVLGPTCMLVLRRFADGFDRTPDGFSVSYTELSNALGLGDRDTKSAPLRRALRRLEQFGLASLTDDGTVLARRHVPPIHRKHINRLPPAVSAVHHEWAAAQLTRPANEIARARARRVALCLFEEGESPDCVERSLTRIGFSTAVAREAITWAVARHVAAARAVAAAAAGGPAA